MRIPTIDRLDAWIYDARLSDLKPVEPDPHVVIVDIDESSLRSIGRWPWSRKVTAEMTRNILSHYNAKAVGFDMVFAESESTEADLALVDALREQSAVLGYYLTSDRAGHRMGEMVPPAFTSADIAGRNFRVTNWSGFGANLPLLVSASGQAGFFNAISDGDGVFRSAPLLAKVDDKYYESLALGLYRRWLMPAGSLATDLPLIRPVFTQTLPLSANESSNPSSDVAQIQAVRLIGKGDMPLTVDIPVDDRAAVLIPYRGVGGAAAKSFHYVSAKDVLAKTVDPALLANKIVLVGSSAPTMEDLRVTPVGVNFPGVEVQANLVSGLISGNTALLPDYARGVEVFQLLLVATLLIFAIYRLSALPAVVFTALLAAALWYKHAYAYTDLRMVLPLASSLLCLVLLFVIHITQGFFRESRRRKKTVDAFGKYLSPQWVDQVVRAPDGQNMAAKSEVLTVMFSDMRGFTKLSETMPPLELQALLSKLFTALSTVIQESGGTIDKFMGDCVMAFWGAPEPQSDHAARAIRCATQMLAAIERLNTQTNDLPIPITMGIGVHTGLMCVGDMGSELRRSYTVIGGAVNVAARLESATKSLGCQILVSKVCAQAALAQDAALSSLAWQDMGEVSLPGVEHALPAMAIGTEFASATDIPTLTQAVTTPMSGAPLQAHAKGAGHLRVLGCSGAIAAGRRTTSFLIDETLLLDAGTGVGDLSLEEMRRIDHVLITHTHLDHIAGLVLMADSVTGLRETPVKVYGLKETLSDIKQHVMNNRIWPDFTRLPSREQPALEFIDVQMGEQFLLGKRVCKVLSAKHTVAACGYAVGDLVFSGDTGENPEFWAQVNDLAPKALIVETAFSEEERELAKLSLHLSPAVLITQLQLLNAAKLGQLHIYLTHAKPSQRLLVESQLDALLAQSVFPWKMSWLSEGQVIDI